MKLPVVVSILAAASSTFAATPTAPTAAQLEFFENRIRPVLAQNCYKCHSAESKKVRGGLLLDTREGLRKGGETGPGLIPGDSEKSLLLKAVRHTDPDLQMPPKGEKLSETQIADLVAWVKMGAPDPRVAKPAIAENLPGGEMRACMMEDMQDRHPLGCHSEAA
jgi:mono/diheme cytochrome c family protein